MKSDFNGKRPKDQSWWRRNSGTLLVVLLVVALGLASTITYLTFLGQLSPEQAISTIMVQIDYGPEGGNAPLTVSFHANVTGGKSPYSYSWDFGDGANSTSGPGVVHTYASLGTYTVQLTVSCLGGRFVTASKLVRVYVN